MANVDRQKEYVLRTVEERGVRLVRLWFTDVLGQLKSFAISPAELENAFEEGMPATDERHNNAVDDGFMANDKRGDFVAESPKVGAKRLNLAVSDIR